MSQAYNSKKDIAISGQFRNVSITPETIMTPNIYGTPLFALKCEAGAGLRAIMD